MNQNHIKKVEKFFYMTYVMMFLEPQMYHVKSVFNVFKSSFFKGCTSLVNVLSLTYVFLKTVGMKIKLTYPKISAWWAHSKPHHVVVTEHPHQKSHNLLWLGKNHLGFLSGNKPWLIGLGTLCLAACVSISVMRSGTEQTSSLSQPKAVPGSVWPNHHVWSSMMMYQQNLRTVQATHQQQKEIKALGDYISKTYRITPKAAYAVVDKTYAIGQQEGIDPTLLLAVISVESRFNPWAGSSAGAVGLTQTMAKAHPEKIAKLKATGRLTDMDINVQLGAQILREYHQWHHGDWVAALQQYNGNMKDSHHRYANKVLQSQSHFLQVLTTVAQTG